MITIFPLSLSMVIRLSFEDLSKNFAGAATALVDAVLSVGGRINPTYIIALIRNTFTAGITNIATQISRNKAFAKFFQVSKALNLFMIEVITLPGDLPQY
jgi:hypothetical protein